jgi:hypothetical protein
LQNSLEVPSKAKSLSTPARAGFGFLLTFVFCAAAPAQEFSPEEFTPCQGLCQSLVLSGGNQFITENGNAANGARLVGVDERGDQLALPFLGGLPTGVALNGSKFGPLTFSLNGRTLFIALGESDQFHTTGPAFNRVTPTAFSPSIIQVTFSADPLNSGPFALSAANREELLKGGTVTLTDWSSNTATFSQVAELGSSVHPVGLATLAKFPNQLFVLDSGTKQLREVDLKSHAVRTIAQFPMATESVSALDDHRLLVTFFTPESNASSVWLLDLTLGTSRKLILNLTSAVDAVSRLKSGLFHFLVLENSGGPQGLGQIIDQDQRGNRTVLTKGLNDPTSLAIDEGTGRLFVYSRGDGVIYSVPLD